MKTEEARAKTAPEDEEPKKYRGIKAMPYIIGNETFEKLGTIGTSANMMVYLTIVFHMKRVTAATLINVWNGTCNLSPLLGAFLSDAYFGRFKTLGFASVASLMGMIMIMLTAGVSNLHPSACSAQTHEHCTGPTTGQLVFLLAGLALLVVGAGGIRSCNLAFGADQFDPRTESGRRGVNSFFNWYFFTFTFAMMVAITLIVWVQVSVSWALGFGIPAFLMLLSCTFFFVGSRIYVKVEPEGSPFSGIAQVLVAAARKREIKHPEEPMKEPELFNPPHTSSLISKLPHTEQFRFLDKAVMITDEDKINQDGFSANPWRLCPLQQVEELKCILRVIPVWAAGIIYYVAVVQQSTFVVVQALQSNRHLFNTSFQIPAASFTVFTMLALTLWIPVYDRLLVPAIHHLTGKEGGITLLQRMGAGVFLSALAMLVSGLIEQRRRSMSVDGGAVSDMSGLWLIPQLLLTGLSEAFASVGQVEFYYKQFPEHMRSLAGSMLFLGIAMSNYSSGLMVAVVHRLTKRPGQLHWLPEDLNMGRLDYFYFMIAGFGALNFAYFLACASWYRYKESEGGIVDGQEVELEPNKSNSPLPV